MDEQRVKDMANNIAQIAELKTEELQRQNKIMREGLCKIINGETCDYCTCEEDCTGCAQDCIERIARETLAKAGA